MPNTPTNVMADGTIRPCRFVKLTSSFKVQECDANESVFGISQEGSNVAPLSDLVTTNNAAIAGQQLRIFGDDDDCLLEVGAACDAGNFLKSDADGKGTPIATTGTTVQEVGAQAVENATADGQKIRVRVIRYKHRPAIV